MERTKFITFIMCAVLAVLMTSCVNTNEYDVAENENNMSNSLLLEKLNNYNDSVLCANSSTRGSGKRILNVVKEDMFGACCGASWGYEYIGKHFIYMDAKITIASMLLCGAIYGGFRSYKAAPKIDVDKDGKIIDIDIDKNNKVKLDSLKPFIPSVVKDHASNVSENSLVMNDTSVLKRINIDDKILSSVHLTKDQLNLGKLHNVMLAAMDGSVKVGKPYDIKSSDQEIQAVMESPELEIMYNAMGTDKEKELFGEYEKSIPNKVMELFDDVFENSSDDYDSIVKLINDYADMIDRTDELTDNQKMSVKNGLATAIYSLNYWRNKK